jgi:hypothetical protein
MMSISQTRANVSVRVIFNKGRPNTVRIESTDRRRKEAVIRVGKVSAVGQAPDIRDFLVHLDETSPSFIYGISEVNGTDISSAGVVSVKNEFETGRLTEGQEYTLREQRYENGTGLYLRTTLISNASVLFTSRLGNGEWHTQALTVSNRDGIPETPIGFILPDEEYRIEGVFGSWLMF